jgi:hypothetical protein
MTTYYHGSHNGNTTIHKGICLTESRRVAEEYADGGIVMAIKVDESGLSVIDVGGYDHDDNDAPGDDGSDYGADVLRYEDEDERGREHTTWRLMSAESVEASRVVSVYSASEDE